MDTVEANIIINHDFSDGLLSWHANSCKVFVSDNLSYAKEIKAESGSQYAVVSNRTECWQGLEQDITPRLLPHVTYNVSALVRIWGSTQKTANVLATLKLADPNSAPTFLTIGRTTASKERWEKLEGTFSLKSIPNQVIFYMEGPLPGIDLLIDRVHVFSATKAKELLQDEAGKRRMPGAVENIIVNPKFNMGLHGWFANSCNGSIYSDYSEDSKVEPNLYAVVSNRRDSWQGLEQDITGRIMPNVQYHVLAYVRLEGPPQSAHSVQATLKLENKDASPKFLSIARVKASVEKWEKLEGTFSLKIIPGKTVCYLEGPPAGFNLLIKSVEIFPALTNSLLTSMQDCMGSDRFLKGEINNRFNNEHCSIIQNPLFDDGLNHWTGRSCKIVLRDVAKDEHLPSGGKHYASATERTQTWNGIQQDISGRVESKSVLEVSAYVRITGSVQSAEVRATLWVQTADLREQYITMGKVQASVKEWVQLQGRFLLNPEPAKAVAFLEGPPAGIDILVDSFFINPAKKIPPSPRPIIQNPGYGLNIVENINLFDDLKGWFPLGPCSLKVATGSPNILPPAAGESLGWQQSLSGRYILVTNRSQNWQGPAQIITEKLKLFITYQVSAWVRVGSGGTGSQNVNVALSVDNQWVTGGEMEADVHEWREVAGSFRLEKKPSNVMLYVQGPSPGVDLMVAGLQIFAVDGKARFEHLKKQTQKLRMRDVILKISGQEVKKCPGLCVKVKQTSNSFALGTCINRSSIDNEDYVAFFVKNFNWAVFENEMKWPWTEPQKGQHNYRDADDLTDLCKCHGIQIRGHCIFWEDQYAVPQWVRTLNKEQLQAAIKDRIVSLLSRYSGRFQHFDVNNEMLHNSFYQDRLGKQIWASMFKMVHELDPSATLFVNEYHVEDGRDARSSPEKYIDHIVYLQTQGAPVGGIGIQGHSSYPVGSIISSALNKLSVLGLPIWFTEVDVHSVNEFVRADDLEVVLREAFAHPDVEGVLHWGFWELAMATQQAHLVDADGTINETGKRFRALKKEWTTKLEGFTDHQNQFQFRGFYGAYEVEVSSLSKKVKHKFVVDKGDTPLVIEICF
ncbi:endo-1,4-beta-xylanase 3 isoform X1 [Cryptomeria japonica]|uniref:endo-1,4-beta-xylanase 3 isoform X1 n=1 Tax=Cryptomeria japonica TaxID=3369 RepID=UPI0025AD0B2F|nr:endo-1,4-beta-xylanase 3 isoform X1 [Cryptomeria japonica]XP_057856955.1 endo-1,4-beta-xylanase 3 isoform X1 [Cryptomeria japonica]